MRVPPGFTLLHRHFVCKAPHAPRTLLSPGPRLGASKGEGMRGAELGDGSRWRLHSRCSAEAVGIGKVLQRHLAN